MLRPWLPTFIYMDDMRAFKGTAYLDQIKSRKDANQLQDEDRTILTIMEMAGLDLDAEVAKGGQSDREQRMLDLKDASQTLTNDRAAFANGEDNTWSRTLRLLYVCATRAKRGLAMVFFVENPATTFSHIVASGIFPEGSVITQDILTS